MKKEINTEVNSAKSEKKLKTIFFVECGVVAVLILILVVRLVTNGNKNNTKPEDQVINIVTESSSTQEPLVNIDDSLSASYSNLIIGSFTSNDGHLYTFGTENVFVGYIDENNTNVTGTYSISTNGSKSILVLNAENIQKNYAFKFTSDGGIELVDEQTNETIVLN